MSLTSLKNTKDYSIYQSFPKPTWKYRIESGRLSTHLGPSWKRKCSILRRFFRPRKKVGHEFFLRHYLSLSLPSPSSHPYTLSCPTSQRNPPRLPSYVCVPSNRSPASLVNRSLNRDTKNYSNKFTIRGRRRSYRHNPFENSMISSIIIPLFSNVQRVYLKRRAEPFSR